MKLKSIMIHENHRVLVVDIVKEVVKGSGLADLIPELSHVNSTPAITSGRTFVRLGEPISHMLGMSAMPASVTVNHQASTSKRRFLNKINHCFPMELTVSRR